MVQSLCHFFWINENYIELIDNFTYVNNKPLIPDDNFIYIDIYGNQYINQRDGLPPLENTNNNIINYYW
jgi:hypothetical protein